MKTKLHSLFVLLALVAILVSACGPVAAGNETSSGGDKPRASLVEFTGIIEGMDGNQWTINGQTITVDDTILRDGPFQVGDTVKVEAEVQADGSVVVTRVELPTLPAAQDPNANANDNSNSSLDNANVNSNDNTNGSSLTGGINSNDDNSNGDDHGGLSNSNDDDDDDNSNSSISNSNDDDHGGNRNSNDDDDDDDDNSNGSNSNDDDDDDDDDHSGNGNGNDD